MWRKSNCQKQLELTDGEAGEATLGIEVKGVLSFINEVSTYHIS